MIPLRSTVMSWCEREPALRAILARAVEAFPEAIRVYHRYSGEIAEEFLERVAAGGWRWRTA